MDKSKTCFFTGHRKIAQSKIEIVKAQLAENIEKMITEYGVNTFIDGGALGFDTIAAETVIEMREKYQNIKLVMYLPCYGQRNNFQYNSGCVNEYTGCYEYTSFG